MFANVFKELYPLAQISNSYEEVSPKTQRQKNENPRYADVSLIVCVFQIGDFSSFKQ